MKRDLGVQLCFELKWAIGIMASAAIALAALSVYAFVDMIKG